MSVRLALAFSFAERYATLGLTLLAVFVTSRMMTPHEVGVVAIGAVALTLLEVVRDFGVGAFIIQSPSLTRETFRSAVTVYAIFSFTIALSLYLAAPALAGFFRAPELETYLRVCAAAQLFTPFNGAIIARLQRDMAFASLAAINVTTAAAASFAAIAMVWAGYSAMSFAYANLLGAVVCALCGAATRPDWSAFRPRLAEAAAALRFGGAATAIQAASRLVEALPQLVVSMTATVAGAGLFGRASTLCQLPDKILGTGVANVALPALATRLREGRELREPLLGACAFLTALQWPATAVMIVLAHPIALLLLGRGWDDVASIAQVLLIAQFFRFPAYICNPTLTALGRQRTLFAATAAYVPILALALALAAPFGPHAAAMATAASACARAALLGWALRRVVALEGRALLRALAPSLTLTFASLAGPLALTMWSGGWIEGVGDGLAAAATAAAGWGVAVYATGHPIAKEFATLAARLRGRAQISDQARASISAIRPR